MNWAPDDGWNISVMWRLDGSYPVETDQFRNTGLG